jgi:hypothetical protein
MAAPATRQRKMVTKTEPINEIVPTAQPEEDFKQKFLELSEAFEQLSKQFETMQQPQKKSSSGGELKPNEFIKVMSLLNNKLNLGTQPHGRGKNFSFEHFGEIKNILYSDLIDINNNQRNFMEAGYYYILDDRVIEEEGLGDIYARILNKKQIEDILSNKATAISLFQKANSKQQTVLINFICEKILNGEQVDYNLVNEVDRIAGSFNEKYVKINDRVQKTLEAKQGLEKGD